MLRVTWSAFVVAVAVACSGAWSCASSSGYLVVAITTDMQAPKDVDAFAVLVSTGGVVKYDYVGFAPPAGSMSLPATLVVAQPKDPSAEVRLRVVAFHHGAARVVRDVITTVPSDRSALLRVPVSYLDDGSAAGSLPAALSAPGGAIAQGDFDPLSIVSSCDLGRGLTSIGGRCASAVVDSSALPDYDPSAVFGAGPCFDVASCFGGAGDAGALDTSACTLTLAASGASPSLALATSDGTGACADASHCYVPLDDDGVEGWTNPGVAQLAPGVCAKVAAGARVVASPACATKSPSSVACASAVPVGDGGVDATLRDAESDAREGGIDATIDAPTGPLDAGPDCEVVLARMLAAPIVPPNLFAGLDLSNGGSSNGQFGSGGLSVDQGDLIACANYVEPTVLSAGTSPSYPGYRMAAFGRSADAGADPVWLEFNAQSRAVYLVNLYAGYTGHLFFQSRAGGRYGSHTYEMSIENPVTGAPGEVLRDGMPYVAQWNFVLGDGGARNASPWVNELYDGLMASFMPTAPPIDDCYSTMSPILVPESVIPENESSCLVVSDDQAGNSIFGARLLHFYFQADVGTNRVNTIYAFWPGATTSCAQPTANQERMDWQPLSWRWQPIDGGAFYYSMSLGGLWSFPGIANPAGITEPEANGVQCNGVGETPPDPGYGMVHWGSLGELAMEYNKASGVNYKMFARRGYLGGLFEIPFTTADGGTSTYSLEIDGLKLDGSPVTIDWTSVATATPTLTAISNAWTQYWCTAAPDTDCVAAGNCTITPDDGMGHSSFVLSMSQAVVDACGVSVQPVGLIFPKGTSDLTQLYIVNGAGK